MESPRDDEAGNDGLMMMAALLLSHHSRKSRDDRQVSYCHVSNDEFIEPARLSRGRDEVVPWRKELPSAAGHDLAVARDVPSSCAGPGKQPEGHRLGGLFRRQPLAQGAPRLRRWHFCSFAPATRRVPRHPSPRHAPFHITRHYYALIHPDFSSIATKNPSFRPVALQKAPR